MPTIGFLKNKKILLASGIVFLLIVGFFVFKLLIGGDDFQTQPPQRRTTEATRTRSRTQTQTKAQSQTQKGSNSIKSTKADTAKKLPGETPLYSLLKGWRDPFGNGNKRVSELEEKIKIIKMEIELLRSSLEQQKLKEELADLKKSRSPDPVLSSIPETSTKKSEPKKITVKAILISENGETALLYFGNKKAWVRPGDNFEGWDVSDIDPDRVVLIKEGENQILSYHSPPVYQRSKNE